MDNCIFCKIVDGQIPSERLYEDQNIIVIRDINPQSRLHFLMISKTHYNNITDWAAKNPLQLGQSLQALTEIAQKLGFSDGFRLVTNNGLDARQSVGHVHIHMLGGQKLSDKMG